MRFLELQSLTQTLHVEEEVLYRLLSLVSILAKGFADDAFKLRGNS